MIPTGFIVFAIACGLFLFVWGFVTLKDRPSFGDMADEDKKTVLLCHPETKHYIKGDIELQDDELVFKGPSAKESVRMPYGQISKCRVYWPRLLKLMGPSTYNYLGIFKEGVSEEFLSFKFSGRAYPYVKELCDTIRQKVRARGKSA